MELEFKRVGSRWVAEFEATGKFNLHIERKKRGSLALFQKGVADGEYASDSVWSDSAEAVVDKDFSAEIYPKYFKVTSGSEVVNGVVTMEGEGSSGGGANIVSLTNQCRVTFYDTAGAIGVDGTELTPDENGQFTLPGNSGSAYVRVFSPFLYIPDVVNLMSYWNPSYITWNKEKQCFDINVECLPITFSLSIIE